MTTSSTTQRKRAVLVSMPGTQLAAIRPKPKKMPDK